MSKFKKGDRVMVGKRDSWPASPGTVECGEYLQYGNHYHVDVMRDDGITNKNNPGSSMICDTDWLTLLDEQMVDFKIGDRVQCIGRMCVARGDFGEVIGQQETGKRWFVKWDDHNFPEHGYTFADLKFEEISTDQKIKLKEKKSMNPTIAKMYGKNTADEANVVEKHFGSDFGSLTSLQALCIKKDHKIILDEAKRREAEAKKKANQSDDLDDE